MSSWRVRIPRPTSGDAPLETDPLHVGVTHAGTTRFDLVCGPEIERMAQALARGWARDRVLPASDTERLSLVVLAVAEHGLRFEPRGLTMVIRWMAIDRIRVDLRWQGGTSTARPVDEHPAGARGAVGRITGVLDDLTEDWGFARGDGTAVQWFVLATR